MSRYRKQGGIIDRELKQICRAHRARGSGKPMEKARKRSGMGRSRRNTNKPQAQNKYLALQPLIPRTENSAGVTNWCHGGSAERAASLSKRAAAVRGGGDLGRCSPPKNNEKQMYVMQKDRVSVCGILSHFFPALGMHIIKHR